MKRKFDDSLTVSNYKRARIEPISPREEEKHRLEREARGRFAPSKNELHEKQVNRYVQKGLDLFDRREQEKKFRTSAKGIFAPSKNKLHEEQVEKYVQAELARYDARQNGPSKS